MTFSGLDHRPRLSLSTYLFLVFFHSLKFCSVVCIFSLLPPLHSVYPQRCFSRRISCVYESICKCSLEGSEYCRRIPVYYIPKALFWRWLHMCVAQPLGKSRIWMWASQLGTCQAGLYPWGGHTSRESGVWLFPNKQVSASEMTWKTSKVPRSMFCPFICG